MPTVNDKKFVLDVSQDPKEKGKLIIWKKKGDRNQLFRIVYNPNNGWYQIISCLDQRVISAPGNAPDNGQLLVEDNKFMQGQSWKIELIPDKKYNDRYYVKNGFQKYLDICENKMKAGTAVLQYDYGQSTNQQWIIQKV